jgi:ABC-type uncharacterized transport system substrate-binding protein
MMILAFASAAVQAAKYATTSIPIVFAATGDPIGQSYYEQTGALSEHN